MKAKKLTPVTYRVYDINCKKNYSLRKKGEDIMKKLGIMMIAVVMLVALTGCNLFKEDDVHANVGITTSSGQAYVCSTWNGAGKGWSGQRIALSKKVELTLKKGETANVTFKCDACGNEQTYEITEAWSEVLKCDCPEQMDDKGNAREYVAICISYE